MDLEKCGRLTDVFGEKVFTCCPKGGNEEHTSQTNDGGNYMRSLRNCASEAETNEIYWLQKAISKLHCASVPKRVLKS